MKDGFKGSRAIVVPKMVIDEIECKSFSSKLHITDIGYYPSAHLHHIKRDNGISQYVLIYCVDGEGWYKIGGKRYEVKPNQCFILPASTPHEYGTSLSNPWSIYWIHFKGEFASFFGNISSLPITISPSNSSRIKNRLDIFEDIFKALSNGYSIENIEFATSALYYFLGSIKYLEAYRGVNKDENSEESIVDRAISYMKENVERSITLQDICEYSGYSESYFSSMFKRKTGHTPINYMIQIRMQVACQFLDFTDMKVNQICHKVGISDPYYFSKLFAKTMGMSPSTYKASKKG
ncbi:MAG: AraC family transcriptional regulator [Rikenellaceae bacterium]